MTQMITFLPLPSFSLTLTTPKIKKQKKNPKMHQYVRTTALSLQMKTISFKISLQKKQKLSPMLTLGMVRIDQ
jgi:hypothetical protein